MQATEHMVAEGGAVIFNPTAGRGQGEVLKAQAQEFLGSKFEFIPTRRAGHATELAKEAAKTHKIVCALGGDGTVGDVARGILGSESALGVLPVGTGNDFARNLGLKLDLKEACATVLGGVTKHVDVGYINEIPFINNCGTGFDAQVMHTMNTSIRFTRGPAAFNLAILKTLGTYKPFTLTLEADGQEKISEKAFMVSVLNGPMYAAGMLAAPRAEIDDGLLDVMVIRALPKAQLLPLIVKVRQGTHTDHPAIRMFQTRKLTLQTVPPQRLNVDGDLVGLTPATVTVQGRALRVLVR
jgi:YegS/Rv2252/BmrU family lipid kinase